jgi:hypothetical protein
MIWRARYECGWLWQISAGLREQLADCAESLPQFGITGSATEAYEATDLIVECGPECCGLWVIICGIELPADMFHTLQCLVSPTSQVHLPILFFQLLHQW